MDSITNNLNNVSLKYSICKLCRKKFNKIDNTNFCHKCSSLVIYKDF